MTYGFVVRGVNELVLPQKYVQSVLFEAAKVDTYTYYMGTIQE